MITNGQPLEASPFADEVTPQEIRQFYGVNAINNGSGSGQTIAIVDAGNDPNIFDSVQNFDQNTFTSPANQNANNPLSNQFRAASSFLNVFAVTLNNNTPIPVNINAEIQNSGAAPVPNFDSTGVDDVETDLDVEWAHAIAPAAKIDLWRPIPQTILI